MKVERQDNILRYLVESRSRVGVQHVVELDLYGGNGGCTCEDFTFRLEPMLKKGMDDSDGDLLRCDHITAARRKLLDDIIETVAHKPELATPQDARQRAERKPPGRYSPKPRKRAPRPASAQR
jgi:hypothetical protein